MNLLPPKWATRFIDWLTADGKHADIPGDLDEEFAVNKKVKESVTHNYDMYGQLYYACAHLL